MKGRGRKWLAKKAKAGFRGYPMATIAFYGPDNRRASKAAIGFQPSEEVEVDVLERLYSDDTDLRSDAEALEAIGTLLRERAVRSVVVLDRIIGCPHEEGIDYPDGEVCPQCPFWAGRDRFAG